MATDLIGKIALVTGASRGVGASTARQLAKRGADVVINFRSKTPRAEEIAAAVRSCGRRALLAQADLTDDEQVRRIMAEIDTEYGRLDIVVLNASGGMEKDRSADYARQLNVDAQLRIVDLALPRMLNGGRIVFVTSHLAHFYGQVPSLPEYEPVAASKRMGEDALRARIDELSRHDVRLIVVSGDMIDGTITARLLNRLQPGLIAARREEAGALPTVDEFAAAIVAAAADSAAESGSTIYVGKTAHGTATPIRSAG